MDDMISRQAAMDILTYGLDKIPMVNNTADEMIRRDERIICIQEIRSLPSAQPDIVEKILAAGKEGKEVRIYIGGRLFAVRELAQ